ncbi:hypothetical protein MKK68_03955 [Methylobacterium sp. E-016]|uniref:hypothetical protein n=1 Tax=Methylobacterium sp. E-016 TaxID=2836556 RepID=UPI001FBA68B1|nr:hypothetical protein [Methylobacterium sp. E-016]MCJ2074806.1 hypothetical protein [Methylobacterium sp. E-016]
MRDEAHWLAEGFHRFNAAREAELETIACEVRPGGLSDAILHSVGANATHGLRRSNADKRRAVAILLEDPLVALDPETGTPWSDRAISRLCSVDHKFVAKVRAPITGDIPSDTRAYPDRWGNVSQMRTAAIGRKPAAAPPEILADGPAPAEPQAEAPPPALSPAPSSPEPTNVVPLAPRLSPLPTPVRTRSRLGHRSVTQALA